MKVALLAGGAGTRLAEETVIKPKPMVEIGGKPVLWHIMQHYAHFGHKDFVIALGYKGEYIKKYMVDYCALHGDISVDFQNGRVTTESGDVEDWKVELIETGRDTLTGGRIRRLQPHIGNQRFMLTWGDGVSNVDLEKLLDFHVSHGKLATVTAVRPPARFGKLHINDDVVERFSEKPQMEEGWINGAYFVLEPEIFNYIGGDLIQWEKEPMERLAREGQLMAYKHHDFWQCMDTLRDKKLLEDLWQSGDPPWRTWLDQSKQLASNPFEVVG